MFNCKFGKRSTLEYGITRNQLLISEPVDESDLFPHRNLFAKSEKPFRSFCVNLIKSVPSVEKYRDRTMSFETKH